MRGPTLSRIIEVIDYDSSWPLKFEAERKLLASTLGAVAVKIHHIGSTSVPGLAAKPIIDILLEVTSLDALDAIDGAMEAIGYVPRGELGIPGRRFYMKGGDDRSHHIHAYVEGDTNLRRHLAFRDYLIANPDIAEEYAALKKAVAASCNNDSERYCDGKDDFVKRHEALALKEKLNL